MRPVLAPDEARRVDETATVSAAVLMERAGLAVALQAVAMGARYGARVAVLAGTGNNGGDGYVAARHLASRGVAVRIYAAGTPRRETAAAAAARAAGIPVRPLGDEPEACDLVVDALFGIGFRGELPDEAAAWTAVPAPVLAVDVPSGLDAATGRAARPCLAAARTVTFHALKVGHLVGDGPDVCGDVVVADIGLSGGDPTLRLAEASDAPRPARKRTEHKWSAGSVLVLGGGEGMTGAALLAATAALHSGAGAVAVAAPRSTAPLYAAATPDVLTRVVGRTDRFEVGDAAAVIGLQDRFRCLVIGPGLGTTPPGFVDEIVSGWHGPVVVDADGINGLGTIHALAAAGGPVAITPHAGEFTRLTGEQASYPAAARLAAATGCTVLLKGNPTFVADEELWVVSDGGPELATIGTGDVLSGMIGAFAAAGIPLPVAARSAAWHHAVAGRRLAASGPFTASELAAAVGGR